MTWRGFQWQVAQIRLNFLFSYLVATNVLKAFKNYRSLTFGDVK